MKNALVRKFQMPPATAPQGAMPDQAPAAQPVTAPATDVDIPEINTHFINNLFTDSSFVERFDVSFDQTTVMGLDGEVKRPAAPAPDRASQDWPDLLDLSQPKS